MKDNVAIYVRVSTQEQAKEGYSIAEQTKRLQKYAEAHGWAVYKVYTDAGHSGASMQRPALQDLLSDVRAGKIAKVLVYKLDRLSRSQKDTLRLIEDEFLKNGTDFESMTERLDTGTAHGRAMIGILAAFAQLEREMIKERMSMGISARIKEGKWRGARMPYGYDYDPTQDKLVINPYQAMIVKQVFQQFTAGRPISAIAADVHIDAPSLRYILSNKTYCGYMRHCGSWIHGLHDAIIDEDTYDAAQDLLQENKRRRMEGCASSASSTLLGGLLVCGKCGAKYGKCKTGTKKYGYKYHYGCYSRSKKIPSAVKDPSCRNKYYDITELDDAISEQIKQLALDPEYFQSLKQPNDVPPINAIKQQLKTINTQLSRFLDLYGAGRFSINDLDAKTQPLTDQREQLQKELDRLQASRKHITSDQAIQLAEAFDSATLEEKQIIIKQLIDKIIINDDDISIYWNFI